MKIRLHGRSQAAKAARAPGTRSAPEPVGATWARAQLRQQIQRISGAEARAAATYVRELRERDPLPEPDRTPGAPHPDPFLASRGWQINQHGIYTRRTGPEPQAAPHAERELEAEP